MSSDTEQFQQEKRRSLFFLSILCFALADVRDGLGPFLGVFLQSEGWTPDTIGFVASLGGFAGMAAAVPAGAFADATRHKRFFLAAASGSIVFLSLLVLCMPHPAATLFSQVMQGIMAASIAPLLSGITLGMAGFRNFPARLGRNEAWNHAGNASTALAAGILGYFWGITAAFAVMAVMGILAIYCVLHIRPGHIDYHTARGAAQPPAEAEFRSPLTKTAYKGNPALLCFGLILLFFHLGNAALLPLLGQAAVAHFGVNPASYTAGTILVAQCIMIPASLLTAKSAQRYGYGPALWCALAALPLRGLIACFWASPWSILPVQILDGVGAGILGVATPGIAARLLQGTGHVNAGLGFAMTLQGIGAALSASYGGLFAHHIGFQWAFLALGGASVIALAVLTAGRRIPSLRAALGTSQA